jgi:hypothetical protein
MLWISKTQATNLLASRFYRHRSLSKQTANGIKPKDVNNGNYQTQRICRPLKKTIIIPEYSLKLFYIVLIMYMCAIGKFIIIKPKYIYI